MMSSGIDETDAEPTLSVGMGATPPVGTVVVGWATASLSSLTRTDAHGASLDMRRLSTALRSRSGFTLVELLVVIAVIGILVSLLLPAVQAAREAARRSACGNNLRQVALAAHNYESTHRQLPIGNSYNTGIDGTWDSPGGRMYRSWIVPTLPFLEESSRYDLIDQNRNQLDDTVNASGVSNRWVVQQLLPVVICPADGGAEVSRTRVDAAAGIPLALTCYAANIGDHHNGGLGVGHAPGWGNQGSRATPDIVEERTRGVISRYGWSARFVEISDGLSKTFLCGEVVPDYDGLQDWGHQNLATTAFPINFRNADWEAGLLVSGRDWAYQALYRSFHPTGAQFAYCDGSVAFLTEGINHTLFRSRASRAGEEVIGESGQ